MQNVLVSLSCLFIFDDKHGNIIKTRNDDKPTFCITSKSIILNIKLPFNFQLPEDLPFEYLLCKAAELYKKHPPDVIELDVQELIAKEYVFHQLTFSSPNLLVAFRY